MSKAIQDALGNIDKLIEKLENDIKQEESKVGFKTQTTAQKLQGIRRKKERLDILKEFADKSIEFSPNGMNAVMTLIVLLKFFKEIENDDTTWTDLVQEVVLASGHLTKEDFKNPDGFKKIAKLYFKDFK